MSNVVPWITGRPIGSPVTLYKLLMEEEGFKPELLQTAEEAIEFCNRDRYPLIVVEPELPPGGYQFPREGQRWTEPGSCEYYAQIAVQTIAEIRHGPNRETPIVVLSLWGRIDYPRAYDITSEAEADDLILLDDICRNAVQDPMPVLLRHARRSD